jgi:hypothetical protein
MSSPSGVLRSSPSLLSAVGVLQQDVDVVRDEGRLGGRQPAHGVATLHVLDLDHFGTKIGQHGRRGWAQGRTDQLGQPILRLR